MEIHELNKLVGNYAPSAVNPNDIIDIRVKMGTTFGLYSLVLPNDSCVIAVANNLDEVKAMLKKNLEMVSFKKVDTNVYEMPAKYRGVDAYVADVFRGTGVAIVYNIGASKWPNMPNGMTVKDYITTLM